MEKYEVKNLFNYFIIGILILSNIGCTWYAEYIYYIEDIDLYVKMKKLRNHARIYFSKTLEFETDYIEFVNHPGMPDMDLYYHPPYNIYAINEDGKEIVSIQQGYFQIANIEEHTVDAMGREYLGGPSTASYAMPFRTFLTDSTFFDYPNYHFLTNDDAYGFSIWNPDGDLLEVTDISFSFY